MANASFDLDEALSIILNIANLSFDLRESLPLQDMNANHHQMVTPTNNSEQAAAAAAGRHVSATVASGNDDVCIFCMEGFESSVNDNAGITIPCGHVYHAACISSWLRYSNCCPLCRCSISGEE